MSESQPEPVVFKPKKKKNLRARKRSTDDEDDDNGNREEILWVIWGKNNGRIDFISHNQYFRLINSAKLEETKLAQKLRVKPNGVNVIGLAIGAKVTTEDLLTKVRSHHIVEWTCPVSTVHEILTFFSLKFSTEWSIQNQRWRHDKYAKFEIGQSESSGRCVWRWNRHTIFGRNK